VKKRRGGRQPLQNTNRNTLQQNKITKQHYELKFGSTKIKIHHSKTSRKYQCRHFQHHAHNRHFHHVEQTFVIWREREQHKQNAGERRMRVNV
jgi:dolichyl-phosphate-mannose--protein O-mannosyl transferase